MKAKKYLSIFFFCLQFSLELSKATLTLTRSLPSIPFDLSALVSFVTEDSIKLDPEALW